MIVEIDDRERHPKLMGATIHILEAIGEDPHREGLVGTPDRVARFWQEFIDYDPGTLDVTFEAVEANQMIVVNLTAPIYSLCEHHLLPIEMYVSIGYISEGARVLGLSKLARIAQKHAHRLQLQERYTRDVADEVRQLANTDSVAVLVEGRHFCMIMRGIKTQGTMVTSTLLGKFMDSDRCRAEFLQLAGRSK